MRKWTEDELDAATKMIENGESYQTVADKLNRNKDSVRKKMVRLGVRSIAKPVSPNEWTIRQEEKLISLADKGLTNNELGIEFNKEAGAISQKLNRLGYKRKEKYNTDTDNNLRELAIKGYSDKKISEVSGFTTKEVQSRLRKMNYKRPTQQYRYKVNEIVGQDTLRIVKKTRGKRNQRAYMVQSLKHITTKPYLMNEVSIDNNIKDLYLSNRKICPENSLWANENIREFIIDIEQAKTLAPCHNKPINVFCPRCKNEKKITPNALSTNEDIACKNCPSYLSFPEKVFYQYLLFRDLYYDRHVTPNDFNREFDFIDKQGNIYEVNGEQHYKQSKSTTWKDAHAKSVKSDNEKVEYCKRKNINITFIDARKSNFNFIINNIEKALNDKLTTKEKSMIKAGVKAMDIDLDNMLKEYADGVKVEILSEKYNMEKSQIYSLAKRYSIKRNISLVRVKCVTTGEVFNTVTKASEKYNIPTTNISKACKGTYRTAGTLNGTKLVWEYVD